MKSHREPDYGQVYKLPGDVVSSGARLATARALVIDGYRGGVDDGERAGISGIRDGQSDLSGAA
jgi:hypothetical protein